MAQQALHANRLVVTMMGVRTTRTELFFNVLMVSVLVVVCAVTLYPFVYVLSMSLSDPDAVLRQEVVLFPKGFSVKSYELAVTTPGFFRSYYNTIWYTVVSMVLNVVLTVMTAYPLSRREFVFRSQIMVMIAVTMFFSGGLIPLFILVTRLGLYNSRWAIVLPTALTAWHLIIARVFFQTTIPESLNESARIEGANDITILIRIVFPLSKPIVAVVALFSGVAMWNSFFPALIFLTDKGLKPLSIFLRRILILGEMSASATTDEGQLAMFKYGVQFKYSTIILSILPIVFIYPYFQQYFVKGVMLGAVKE